MRKRRGGRTYSGRKLLLLAKDRSWISARRAVLLAAVLLVSVLLLAGGESFLERRYAPEIMAMALSEVQNRTVTEAAGLISEAMEREEIAPGDIFSMERKADGSVISCRTDTALLNKLGAVVAEGLDRYYRAEGGNVGIPLGNLLGSGAFYARGPRIVFRVLPVSRISCRYETEFFAAGINQTVHRISFRVTSVVTVMGAGGSETVEISESFPVAEVVLIGSVPGVYQEKQGG